MPKPKYKYNLRMHYVSHLLAKGITWKQIEAHLQQYNISARTFQRDRDIAFDSVHDIPTERMLIYAKVFGCEITELINYDVKAKSLVKKSKTIS